MQTAQVLHGCVGALFIAAMLAHIYIGTIGMEGAFEAMGTGEVDENWAKQHHALWLEQEKNRAPSGATPRGHTGRIDRPNRPQSRRPAGHPPGVFAI